MKVWFKYGLYWGLSMLIFLGIFFPVVDGTFSITKVVIGIPVFTTFGLLWGYFMFGRKNNKTLQQ